jgi:3-hydroxybutyryl-CoA dehydratase
MEPCRLASELAVGERASLSHTVSELEFALFAAATGDLNPIHFDRSYAEATFFKGTIAHGMLCAGLISSLIGGRLPGVGTIYVTQTLRFLRPVRAGDGLTVAVEVLEVDVPRNLVRLRTTCTNAAGGVVVDGEALVEPPKKRPSQELARAMESRTKRLEEALSRAVSAFASDLRRWEEGEEHPEGTPPGGNVSDAA